MSGSRPVHLTRRGAVYVVRFRLPVDLAKRVGVTEVRRSLETKDLAEARRRCLFATAWFTRTVEELRSMPNLTRTDLEGAAHLFFGKLRDEVDRHPRPLPPDYFDQELDAQLASARDHITGLDNQLVTNTYGHAVQGGAGELVKLLGNALPDLTEQLRLVAMQLAARAQREQMNYFSHQLTTPATVFEPSDVLFAGIPQVPMAHLPIRPPAQAAGGSTLGDAVAAYLRRKQTKGVGGTQITELKRSLGWLQEVLGPEKPIGAIIKEEMRTFRDDLERVDVKLRGRRVPFQDRLTNDPDKQLKSATSKRYWKAVGTFFEWCEVELSLPVNPTAGLKIERRKGEVRASPEPFSQAELGKLLTTPVFTGYKPLKYYSTPGPCRRRGAHFWAGLLPLFTGIRAGELSQLLLTDFVFDHEIPHLKVRETDDKGSRVKTTKNAASIRDVPIAPVLLQLGLREFVEARQRYPNQRVFEAFRLGAQGRKSDGMSKFWGPYLKRFGLWKPRGSAYGDRSFAGAGGA